MQIRRFPYIVSLILFVVLAFAACTNSGGTADDGKPKNAWHQYNELFTAMDLGRTLAVIDSMEQAKAVSTAKADYLRGIAYDVGWKMRIAEHFYKKAYESFVLKSSQDWFDGTALDCVLSASAKGKKVGGLFLALNGAAVKPTDAVDAKKEYELVEIGGEPEVTPVTPE